MTTLQTKTDAKMRGLPEATAIEVYAGLRTRVMGARAAGRRADASTSAAMVAAGTALEARIGADRFDALIDQIDGTPT